MDIFNSPIVLVVAGIILVLLGIGAGMLISSLSDDGEPEDESAGQTPPGGREGHYKPVARLWRQRDSEALIVETEGKSYVAASAINDEQRDQLVAAARDLRVFLGMSPSAVSEQSRMSGAMTAGVSTTGVSTTSTAASVSQTPQYITPAPVSETPPEADDPDMAIASQKSIVLQIEDILQDMIAGTEMDQKSIHLIEDPIKGVIVRIGLAHYEGIEAVPDTQIKATIRSAVAEWEKTQ